MVSHSPSYSHVTAIASDIAFSHSRANNVTDSPQIKLYLSFIEGDVVYIRRKIIFSFRRTKLIESLALIWFQNSALADKILFFVPCNTIYYFLQCSWPDLEIAQANSANSNGVLKALILADTHLLGPIKGHWLDKWRREYQMHRSFQAIMTVHNPEAVFVLGVYCKEIVPLKTLNDILCYFRHPLLYIDENFEKLCRQFEKKKLNSIFNHSTARMTDLPSKDD